MTMLRIAVPPAIDPACLAGFDPQAPVIALSGLTMGTQWQVRLAHVAGAPSAQALRAQIQARLDRMERTLSHWDGLSRLMRFNRAAPGTWCRLPGDLAQVLAQGLAVARASQGAFDPAIGRLTDAWSLGPNRHAAPPDAATLNAARAASGWQRLVMAEGWLAQPGGLWLDLSAIAKGHAADAVADLLADLGLRHALVEVGGECTGRGMRPDGDPWWVDVESPPGTTLAPLRVALHQMGMATSGRYLGDHTSILPAGSRCSAHWPPPCCMPIARWPMLGPARCWSPRFRRTGPCRAAPACRQAGGCDWRGMAQPGFAGHAGIEVIQFISGSAKRPPGCPDGLFP
jgi:thiamine biosynthesis lipoprotein